MHTTNLPASMDLHTAEKQPGMAARLVSFLGRRWIGVFAMVMGLYVGLPFLAPVLMHFGLTGAGNLIYTVYATQCHQLPERSFFLFGPKAMYSLAEVHTIWQNSDDPMVLRQFIGSAAYGWKVAWSDRMVAMYTATLVFGLVWWPWRKRLPRLPWWGLMLLLLPMAVDGGTHFLSDLYGLGQGFRYSNLWLQTLTSNALPASFYAGDALGSFNSWMRILSGVFFGMGMVGFGFPYIDHAMQEVVRER